MHSRAAIVSREKVSNYFAEDDEENNTKKSKSKINARSGKRTQKQNVDEDSDEVMAVESDDKNEKMDTTELSTPQQPSTKQATEQVTEEKQSET
jgi:hypothetical protein